jgi:spore coat polysaccharide biosynthesis protein SpsF
VTVSTATIIFARCDSRRLPGKVLTPLGGRPLLGRVLDRIKLAQRAGHLIVATTDRPIDAPIVAFAAAEGVACFRGPTHDVAGRALACAESVGVSTFVRISGDSPFIDPSLLDSMMAQHDLAEAEITTNLHPRSFPPGISIEIVEVSAMRKLIAICSSPEEREHVTLHFYRNANNYRIANYASPVEQQDNVSLVVDTEDDLRRAKWITEQIGDHPEKATLVQLVGHARRWQAITVQAPSAT